MNAASKPLALLIGAVLALGGSACSIATVEPAPPVTAQNPGAAPPPAGSALAGLATLQVKGRAPETGYDRQQFGPAWADTDRNGCDTRNDTLARDLLEPSFRPGTGSCVVQAGTLDDPYTATTISFVKGGEVLVDIDHIVALGNAWETGAQQLSAEERRLFANDPLNLLAVDGPSNRQKGDADAATWLPPNRSFRCDYVARQTAVKMKYRLWVTAAERDAIRAVLGSCPDQPLPYPSADERPIDGSMGPPTAGNGQPGEPPVSYTGCAEVRAAGAAPIRVGDPGWNPRFDGNGDGVGCQ
jgi:hypothetical protein